MMDLQDRLVLRREITQNHRELLERIDEQAAKLIELQERVESLTRICNQLSARFN